MRDIIHTGTNSISRLITEGDKGYIHTIFNDKKSLDQNSRIRNAGLLDRGTFDLHDNADVRMVFSCPSPEQWNLFKKKNQATYDLLMSKLEHERMRGAKQLQLLHPEWCVMERL